MSASLGSPSPFARWPGGSPGAPGLGLSRGDLDRLLAYWKASSSLIEERLMEAVRSRALPVEGEVASYIVRGGKRLRGFMALAVSESLGGSYEDALDAAVAVELVQSASLAIDDFIDLDYERRGLEAAWVRYGPAKAVLVSLALIPIAQELVERYGMEAIRFVRESWRGAVAGELLEVSEPRGAPGSQYTRIAEMKTGSLFGLSCALGAIAASRRDAARALYEYGKLVGIAYQIADDLADYEPPARPEREPGLAIFESWAAGSRSNPIMTVERSLLEIESLITKAKFILRAIQGVRDRTLLENLPIFIVNFSFNSIL